MATDYQIGALWIGGALSFLEQLCLVSYVHAGQAIRLYAYDDIPNVPDGVELADANTILPQTGFLRHERTGSPALHSDLFRYHMLAKSDRMIWADTDAYCVKPFTTPNGHFYAWESRNMLNGGVLGLPPDSATLAALLEFTRDEFAIPDWITGDDRTALLAAQAAGKPVHVSELPWGVWGPHAITHFLHKTGEVRFALPQAALYPFGYKDRALMLRPGLDPAPYVTDQTYSIHFYGRRMRARILEKENGIPRPRSLIGQLLKKHRIDPSTAPLVPRAPRDPLGEDDEG